MTFMEYCVMHRNLDSPLGDFCVDWMTDRRAPSVTTLADVMDHLSSRRACMIARAEASKAFANWQKMVKKDPSKSTRAFIGKNFAVQPPVARPT